MSSERPAGKSPELRLVELEPVNGSGVRAVARLLLDGRRLAVDSVAIGATPGQAHMQHIHLPDAGAEGRCRRASSTPTATASSASRRA